MSIISCKWLNIAKSAIYNIYEIFDYLVMHKGLTNVSSIFLRVMIHVFFDLYDSLPRQYIIFLQNKGRAPCSLG